MAVTRPVILLAFANDPADGANYLRNLAEEARLLRAALETAAEQGLCDFELLYNVTLHDILDAFQKPKLRGRIAIFHYGGHADSYDLLLQSRSGDLQRIDGRGFAAFLAEQRSLQLVFLNACSTEPQIDDLLAANVQVVIATAQDVDDGTAAALASHFYGELAQGASLGAAYRQAVAALRAQKGENPDLFYAAGVPIRPAAPVTDTEIASTPGGMEAGGVEAGGSASGGLWPWRLRTRRGAEAAIEWSLPQAAGDPLFGLPPLPPKPLPDSPYQRVLDYYTRDMAELFFGRARQIRELYQRVTAPGNSRVLLYYGQSGVGKSSLLDAGLGPRLQATHAVSYVRRDRTLGLSGTLDRLLSTLDGGGGASGPVGGEGALVQRWREAEQRLGKPLVLILDQVEEVFSRRNPDQPRELEEFAAVLAAIDGGQNRPAGVLLLGFRKERLAEVETALRDQRVDFAKLHLEALDVEGIQEVFWGPVRNERLQAKYNLTVEEALPELVAHDLTADPDSPVAPTLNILLRKLWAAGTAQAASAPRFTVGVYEQLRRDGILLDDFLRQQTATVADEQPDAVTSGLLLDLWAFHTTALGTSDQRDADEVKAAYSHQPSIEALLLRSKELYVLADPGGDNSSSGGGTRLAHDTLAPLVRRDHATSALPGQQARRLLESRAIDWHDGRSGPLLDDAALAVIDKGLGGMRALSVPEQRLLAASRQAQAQRVRNRRLWRGGAAAAALVVLVLLAATLLFWNNQRLAIADTQAALATSQRESERADREEAERLTAEERTRAAQLNNQLVNERERTAAREAQNNESRRLAELAHQQLEIDPVAGLHLALAALHSTAGQPPVPEAEYVLRQGALASLERTYLRGTVTAPGQVAIAGNRVATGGMTPAVYDLELKEQGFSLPADFTAIEGLAWGGDGRLLGWSRDTVWVLGGGEPQRFALDAARGEQVRCAAWQPTQRWVAVCTYDTLYAWELTSGRVLTLTTALDTPESPTEPRSAVWSDDGRRLAGLGARLVLWDSRTPAVPAQIFAPSATSSTYMTFAAWLPDGRSLVAARTPDTPTGINLYRWQEGSEGLESVDLPLVMDEPHSEIHVLYAPDADETPRLLFWSNDGLLALYNLQSEQVVEFAAPPGLNGLVVSPARDRAVGYYAGGSAIIWAVNDLRVLARLDATIQFFADALVTATWLDNDSLVLADQSGLAQLVRLEDGWAAQFADAAESAAALSPPGSEPLDDLGDAAFPPLPPTGPPQLLADNNDPSISVAITRLPGADNPNERLAAARRVADGRLLTAGFVEDGSGSSLRLWQVDLTTTDAAEGPPPVTAPLCGRLPRVLQTPPGLVLSAVHTWGPDNRLLIETENGEAGLWQLGGAMHLLPADAALPHSAFAPDGEHVLRFGDGVEGQIWRLDESSWVQEMAVAGEIVDAQWDAQGILVAFADGSAVLLDAQSGQRRQAPQGIDVAASVLLANGHLLAAQGTEVALWKLGDDRPLASWSSPTGQGLHLDDRSSDGQLFVYRDQFSGLVFVLRANVAAGALAEVWRSEQTAIDSGEAQLHPTLPLLALRNNSTIAVVDLDAQSVLWQSSSVAMAAQTFRAVQWSTDGQYLITQAQLARASSLLINIGVWRWDGVRREPVLLQEVAASRLLGVSPELHWMLAVEAESFAPARGRPILVPVFTDTAQLQTDIEASCLLTRPLSEQQRQAFLIDGR